MRVARTLPLVTPFVTAVVLCFSTGRTSAHASRFELGRPIEGLSLQERKLFRDGKEAFEEEEAESDGLGPIFNNTGCATCHSTPVVGGSSPLNETRGQKLTGNTLIELPGGSLFQSDAISAACRESVPLEANVIAPRQTTPLFGMGLIEAIPDFQIEGYRFLQARLHPEQAGRLAVIDDVASGTRRVGRFGWKNQQATLPAFSGDAYLNEMGITSKLFPNENPPNGDLTKLKACDKHPDPEDEDDDVTLFTNFMRLLAPPPRDAGLSRLDGSDSDFEHRFDRGGGGDRGDHGDRGDRGDHGDRGDRGAARGERVFQQIGCAVCHHAGYVTRSRIEALDGKRVGAYSDFLLHDIGTGDGIAQAAARPNELRTTPLWGLSESAPYLHDGSAATVRDAIKRHGNQAATARATYDALPFELQSALLDFLDAI
ncbi:MAG: di-heme oxidoredictase family protein [Burkholderiales bacterium]